MKMFMFPLLKKCCVFAVTMRFPVAHVPVPVDTWKRSLSPLEMWVTPNCSMILDDTVPLPEAGAPKITALKAVAAATRHVDIATMK